MNEVSQASRPEPTLGRGALVQDECAKEWRPSRSECLRDYQVGIKFLSIGCIISVGCKEVPFATIKDGMKALNDYVANPYETRTIWQERFAKEEEL
jgi:hypothetical protein